LKTYTVKAEIYAGMNLRRWPRLHLSYRGGG
jgi:hypothetical protein